MKYSDIAFVSSKDVCMVLSCSKCGRQADKDDSFCRHCGHKFAKIPKFIGKEDLLNAINQHKFKEYKKKDSKKDSGYSIGKMTDTTSICCCSGGRTSCTGCQYLTTDGYCTMLVCTSCPPQYERCRFSSGGSSQFKNTSDVGELMYPNGASVSITCSNESSTGNRKGIQEYAVAE